MKFEQEINNLESQNFNGDYILLKGSKPILFTAPHTMIQIRENGDIKLKEPYTKALALYFHKHFDTYALIKLNDTGLDSNRDNHDEFKEVMYKLVKEEKIKLVLDLHGAKNSHDFDVEFGTLNNLTADFSTIKELEEAFKENNITNIEHNNPFKGGAITQYLYNIKDVDVIQLEINAKFRDRHNLNKLYSLVCSLTNFIKQYSEYTNLRTSNNLSLFIPNIEDYWYLKKIQEDPKTMSYNAGYDVNYLGYDYDTGCIELKESSWEDEFNKKKDKGIFLAYIKDEELKDYIGYVTYHYNEFEKRYYCGVLIEFKYRSRSFGKKALSLLLDFARKNNIKTLYNSFEEDRADAIKLFTNMGFSIVGSKIVNKFNSPTKSLIIKIDL